MALDREAGDWELGCAVARPSAIPPFARKKAKDGATRIKRRVEWGRWVNEWEVDAVAHGGAVHYK